jgi:RHS repeat-associated protein
MNVSENNNQFLKTDGGKTKSNAIEVPSIALPKGGGALKGIDEKFSVNAVNGTASFSIPLPFSPARGASPSLNLSYNSGSGNGIFGLGWNLGLPSIKRKTDKGLPQYIDAIDSDTFLFSEAEDLVPEFKKGPDGSFLVDTKSEYIINETNSPDESFTIRYYRPRIEGLFARIERWSSKTSEEKKWKVTTKDNVATLFGWTSNARITDPEDETRIYEWLPEFVFDDKGNCSQYLYKKEDNTGLDNTLLHHHNRIKAGQITYTNLYLEKVLYGNKTPYGLPGNAFPPETVYMFQTVFDYGIATGDTLENINPWNFRADAFSNYKAGFEIRTTRLCQRVLLFHIFDELALKQDKSDKKTLIRSVNFDYDTSTEQDFTFLKTITTYGYIKKADGSYSHKKLPPMEFRYQKHDWNKEVKTIAVGDLVHAPAGLDEQQYQFTDLYNEGLSGMLTEQANGWYYKHNLGDGVFEQAKLVSPKPSFTGLGRALQLADLDGDGGKQLVSFGTEPKGFFELDDDNEWQGFRSFKAMPNIDFGDANTRMLDLDGDGKPEILISEDNVFTWYASEGRQGFAAAKKTVKPFDEEAGPHIVFADAKQTIYLADMSGDGMTDILRIRNGEVCYWPNLGYGKFGAKITLDNSPVFDHPDSFNPSYLRLADIDGSGTSDIIYLGKNKFTCWKNLNGNSFGTTPFEIDSFPEIHAQSRITITDLLGNGVACIAWSSPLSKDAYAPLRYIDLMNSKKPHIMVSYKNNLGKEVSFEYTPSTKFYVEDKLAGKPWVTKLHFPVHCISKTITEDKIVGSKFISEYRYHHGYYDHAEREFRGFGMVEQTDAETFENWKLQTATNITEADLHQEPVVSRTWYHTGAFLQKDKILSQFEKDYWYAEWIRLNPESKHKEKPLPDARLIAAPGIAPALLDNLSAQEWQEALRACKGMALRSEVFAKDAVKFGNTDDAREKEMMPFSVATHNCLIELVQPKGKNRHAIFVVKESEAITYHYERNPTDPRVAHNLNIKLDEYGNVLECAAVVYARLLENIDNLLPEETQEEQKKTVIIYTQNQFTNDIVTTDAYRLRMPSEVKTFEINIAASEDQFDIAYFENILSDTKTDEVRYQDINKPLDAGKPQRRLIEHIRSLYYKNDLTGALPSGQLESLAMPFENYQLAYTPELLTDIYGDRIDDNLIAEGKFTHSIDEKGNIDMNWWIRSGTTQFIQGTETNAATQKRFYVPLSYTDPYGAVTRVKYYGTYFLFVEETEDALGNKAGVVNFNFRTLAPRKMKDINGNLSEAISDELGLVKAMAVMGKGTQADDLIGLEEATEDEQAAIDAFFTIANADGICDSADLQTTARQLLKQATTRFIYDFETYITAGKPTIVAAITRETHYRKQDGSLNPESPIQLSFEYSNGLGEVVMKKAQAEPGVARQVQIDTNDKITVHEIDTSKSNQKQLRWIGNGRAIKNNKGNAVKQYEPFFSVSPKFEAEKELVETGVTPIMYYDAAGRLTRTDMPDGTFSVVVFDAWKQAVYDANDTVLDSEWYKKRTVVGHPGFINDPNEKQAADKAAKHYNTPSQLHFDVLGRPVLQLEDNGKDGLGQPILLKTRVELDVEGNLRKVVDAMENTVMQYKYDMLGNMLYQLSMDAGPRWMLNDCMGKPVKIWDAKGHELVTGYDVLHRPLISSLTKEGITTVIARQTYCNTNELSAAELLQKQTLNVVGQSLLQYDSAGITTLLACDFKGKPLETSRQLCKDYKTLPDWTNPDTIVMEAELFSSSAEFDALGRPVKSLTPHTDLIPASVLLPMYNESGLLDSVDALLRGADANTHFVTRITHNAKGQRETIYYGNNSQTKYSYDKTTFRLIRLLTTANSGSAILQDLRYTYDAVGNITHIQDDAQPTIFYDGQKVEAKNDYDYDATYQLIRATGREHIGQNNPNESPLNKNTRNFPFENGPAASDEKALRNYTEHYVYDAVGNIVKMQHVADGAGWTRNYWYNNNDTDRSELNINAGALKNNQLLQTKTGTNTATSYTYDIQGNMLKLPQLQNMVWNYKDQLQQVGLGGGGNAYYVYDGNGQRIRKIIERADGIKLARIYLGAIEIYRETNTAGSVTKQTDTLHIMDDKSRIAMVDTPVLSDDAEEKQVIRFIYSNHLGSSSLELNEKGMTISYEEYHPYGTTSMSATNSTIKAAAKRYRYTGMERDEETGMAYHSARYYLPWLGRWLSADPIGIGDGVNVYRYCKGNPINYADINGKQKTKVQDSETQLQSMTTLNIQKLIIAGGRTPSPCYEAPTELQRQADIDIARSILFKAGLYVMPPVQVLGTDGGPSVGPGKLAPKGSETASHALERMEAERKAIVGNLAALSGDTIGSILVIPSIGNVDDIELNKRLGQTGAVSGLMSAVAGISNKSSGSSAQPEKPLAADVRSALPSVPTPTARPQPLESRGASTRGATFQAASAKTNRSVNTAIRPDIAESQVYGTCIFILGEIGLQRPVGANIPGADLITARRNALGEIQILVTDVKASIRGVFPRPASGSPKQEWMAEVEKAISPERLNLGNPALEAEIRSAYDSGRVSLRQVNVDYSPKGQGRMSGF